MIASIWLQCKGLTAHRIWYRFGRRGSSRDKTKVKRGERNDVACKASLLPFFFFFCQAILKEVKEELLTILSCTTWDIPRPELLAWCGYVGGN
jgi:hypothetical protein